MKGRLEVMPSRANTTLFINTISRCDLCSYFYLTVTGPHGQSPSSVPSVSYRPTAPRGFCTSGQNLGFLQVERLRRADLADLLDTTGFGGPMSAREEQDVSRTASAAPAGIALT